jgi:hypothetical protein
MTAPGNEPGFDTALDPTDADTLTPDEARRLTEWYESSHGEGSTELTQFVPFLIAHRPAALKRYRMVPQAIHDECGLPQAAVALIWLHHYMIIGYKNGVAYQVIAAREWGATKDEVLDLIQLTFLEAGPLGVNAVAERAAAYLDAWPNDGERRVSDPWPPSWVPARERAQGAEAPHYVTFLDQHAPAVLSAMLGRYEQAHRSTSLPAPLIPLLHLHTAAIRGDIDACASAAAQAREAGATSGQAVGTLAFAFLYMNEELVERVVRRVERSFAGWTAV